ncbi:protein krueppel-like, partial [Chiloscyllium plagiosum]|uniref:protein krueppel-like n=1 Tax=Chiloscyllium plagiosum TaxID=36176 RepID=UPI001CB7DEB2
MEKPWKCGECGNGIPSPFALEIHRRLHTGQRLFTCTQLHHLLAHEWVHTSKNPFICPVCGQGFTQSHHLLPHQQMHTREKPFSCSVCGKGYTQSYHLLLSFRVHTGEKPFTCPLWSNDFCDSSTL